METSRGGGDPYTHGPQSAPGGWEMRLLRDREAENTPWRLA